MDTRQLRYFHAVATFRNVSHAAEHLNVAASAVSHHVANLEAELGVALFARKPRGMEPTAAGLRLAAHAETIFAAFETARAEVSEGRAEASGTIAIGMPYSIIRVIGGPLMRRALEEMPRVRLVIREGLSATIYQALRTGEVEAALIFNPPSDAVTLRAALLEEELFCIGAPGIVGDPATPIRLEEMAELPLALLQSGAMARALSDRPAELARLEARARITLASIAATKAALSEGLACTLAPRALVLDELRAGALVARPVTDPRPLRTLHLVAGTEQRPTFLRERMAELIEAAVRDAVARGDWPGASAAG